MTGTTTPLAESWSRISHQQSPMFISLFIHWHSESARCTGSKSRWIWNEWYAKRNSIHLKISLYYICLNIWERYSIEIILRSPKSCSEGSSTRPSADWNVLTLKLISLNLRCRASHACVGRLNVRACWKLYADWDGCPGFHCSEYLGCLLYNPVALLYAFPTALSTPTSCLLAFVFV